MNYSDQDLKSFNCAGFILKTPDNKIVLVKSENKYSFPKGKYEKKKDGQPKSIDTLFSCAKRELVEETNMFNYDILTTKNLEYLYVENNTILYFPAVIINYAQDFIIRFIPNDEISELVFLSEEQINSLPTNEFKETRKNIAISHLNNSENYLSINLTINEFFLPAKSPGISKGNEF